MSKNFPSSQFCFPPKNPTSFSVQMAKRRDRRAPPGPDSRTPPAPPAQGQRTIDAAMHTRISIFFFFLFLFFPIGSVLVYRLIYPPQTYTDTYKDMNTSGSVYERGLVRADVSYKEILAENSKISENTSRRHYSYPVLAYVTPWNSKGYEIAKRFTSKFTHLSPVWYELKSEGSQFVLEGRHNADIGWVSELRTNGNVLVLPRVVLETFPTQLLRKKQKWQKVIDLIVTECKDMGYDGVVLESWSRWAAYRVLDDKDMRVMALDFVKRLAKSLHSVHLERNNSNRHLQLVYVIPAPRSEELKNYDFGPDDFQSLSEDVDGFSLMTYDFSGPHGPGPNAPLNWIRSSLQILLGETANGSPSHVDKIFLGINFYGNDFILSEGSGGGAITGREYLSLMEKHRPVLQWKDNFAEHFFIYSDNNINHAVFYPSLKSISLRLAEARSWGAGISIWEIGQGLDYFFGLL